MRKISLLLALVASFFVSTAYADFTGKNAAGTTITFKNSGDCTAVVCVPLFQLGDGSNTGAIVTAGADAVSNTQSGLAVYSRLETYNGTTWDRWQGAISIASGKVASGAFASGSIASGAMVDLGSQADAAWSSGSGSVISILKTISGNTGAAIPSQSSTVPIGGTSLCDGANGTTNPCTTAATVKAASTAAAATDKGLVVSLSPNNNDPCANAAKTNVAISMQNTTTVKLVSLASSKKIYICSLALIASGATVFSVADGTKVTTECDTAAEAVIGTTTASHGLSLAANGGITFGNGQGTVALTTTASHDLCLFQSGSVDLSGVLTYVQL